MFKKRFKYKIIVFLYKNPYILQGCIVYVRRKLERILIDFIDCCCFSLIQLTVFFTLNGAIMACGLAATTLLLTCVGGSGGGGLC